MNLDLSVASLVRASSGALMVGFGLYLLTVRPATLRSRALGIYHLALGPVFVLINLVHSDLAALAIAYGAVVPLYLAATGALVFLVWRELRRDRRSRMVFATVLALLVVANLAVALLVPTPETRAAADAYDDTRRAYAVFWAAAPAAALAFAFRFRAATDPLERRRVALLAAGLAAYPVFNQARALLMEAGELAHGWVAMPAFTLAALAWALAARGPASAAARNTSLAIVLSGLVGLGSAVLGGGGDDYGLVGASRIFGLAILAYAVFRVDLLGTGFTARTVRRGTIATGALAALFIVAQIAQEFFAAEYGLLMGGVVAGALLFAANPIQRAMERAAGHERVPPGPAPTAPPSADLAEREAAYREAVRFALRDRTLTRDEERHLLRLAYHLGVPTPRALEIHDEVEAGTAREEVAP